MKMLQPRRPGCSTILSLVLWMVVVLKRSDGWSTTAKRRWMLQPRQRGHVTLDDNSVSLLRMSLHSDDTATPPPPQDHRSSNDQDDDDDSAPPTLTIPIFPLRKSARFPTEFITLNLYEDRYLAMAESILAQPPSRQLFGALYTANRPQLVSEFGQGPIVPLLRPGAVGTLFGVTHQEQGDIPTVGGEWRRRIRLEAVGVARFRIQDIVTAGTQSSTDPSLYISAHVSVLMDSAEKDNNKEQEAQWQSILLAAAKRNGGPLVDGEYRRSHSSAEGLDIPSLTQWEQESFAWAASSKNCLTQQQCEDVLATLSTDQRLQILRDATR